MKNDNLSYLGNSFALILTAIQTNEIYQTISLILTILATLLSIAYTIYKWYKKASADGKITAEEIDELKNDLTKKEK